METERSKEKKVVKLCGHVNKHHAAIIAPIYSILVSCIVYKCRSHIVSIWVLSCCVRVVHLLYTYVVPHYSASLLLSGMAVVRSNAKQRTYPKDVPPSYNRAAVPRLIICARISSAQQFRGDQYSTYDWEFWQPSTHISSSYSIKRQLEWWEEGRHSSQS